MVVKMAGAMVMVVRMHFLKLKTKFTKLFFYNECKTNLKLS